MNNVVDQLANDINVKTSGKMFYERIERRTFEFVNSNLYSSIPNWIISHMMIEMRQFT